MLFVLLQLFRSLTPLFRDQTYDRRLGAYNNTFVWHKLQLKPSLLVLAESVLVYVYLMFIGPCIIAIVEEWKTNLMSLTILFHLLCAQHVSDINISIFRSLRLCWWITTSVVLFSVRCVLELFVRAVFSGVRFAGFSLQNEHHQKPPTPKATTHNELRTRRPMW